MIPMVDSNRVFRRKTRSGGPASSEPARRSPADLRRWRRHLADEVAEAAVYRDLAGRRTGDERDILLALAAGGGRHEQQWLNPARGMTATSTPPPPWRRMSASTRKSSAPWPPGAATGSRVASGPRCSEPTTVS